MFSILYYIEILVAQREAKRDVVLCVLVFTLKEHSKAQATQSTIDLDREIQICDSNSYSTVGLGHGWTTMVVRGAVLFSLLPVALNHSLPREDTPGPMLKKCLREGMLI